MNAYLAINIIQKKLKELKKRFENTFKITTCMEKE